jgi:hypothetical protein
LSQLTELSSNVREALSHLLHKNTFSPVGMGSNRFVRVTFNQCCTLISVSHQRSNSFGDGWDRAIDWWSCYIINDTSRKLTENLNGSNVSGISHRFDPLRCRDTDHSNEANEESQTVKPARSLKDTSRPVRTDNVKESEPQCHRTHYDKSVRYLLMVSLHSDGGDGALWQHKVEKEVDPT